MKTLKAGCFLINKQTKCVAIVHREKQNDYSFPKGHVEDGEDVKVTALREVAEETKREARIIEQFKPFVEEYTTPKGEDCICYMYIAEDIGASDNDSWDTHDTLWVHFDNVEDILSYPSLKNTWRTVKDIIAKEMGI